MTSLLEQLGIPEVPHVVFEDTPLALALCQIRFSTVAAVADDVVVSRFQRALQADYPIANRGENTDISLDLSLGTPELHRERSLRWQYSDRDDNWAVVLAQDFVAVETRAYDEFGDFIARLQHVLSALAEHIKPSAGLRVGLRYINEFRPNDLNWAHIIKPKPLGLLGHTPLADHLAIAVQELRVSLPSRDNIVIRHGVLPEGSTIRLRSGQKPPDGPFYLLDFDIFRDFPPPDFLSMDSNEICEYVKAYNKLIYNLFRWSVTDEYVQTLGVRRNG